MDWEGMRRDWRIWLLVILLVFSLAMIFNIDEPYTREDGQVRLNTNVEQGLDLRGGARIMIQPVGDNITDSTISQIITTLSTRISAFGLQETKIRPVGVGGDTFIQIEVAGQNTSSLIDLVNRTGRFEARIPVTVEDGESFAVGERTYAVNIEGDDVSINGSVYSLGESFELSSGPRTISYEYTNLTEEGAELSALAFSGRDILAVDIDSQVSGIIQSGGGWTFRFQVSITEEAARRVRDVVQAFPEGPAGGNLQGAQLELYLDGKLMDSLGIANEFRSTLVQQPLVTGGAQSRSEALNQMNQLKSVLKSGALPVPIRIVSTSQVSATLGEQFLRTATLAIIFAIIAVGLVIYLRYRDPKIVAPLIMTGFSELVLIFGFAALVNWTIDLPSIAGIIAAIGTGVDDQIIITDERGKRNVMSLKKRFKRAFFIIFTSAASTIGAMLPLTQIGAGTITGFAFTAIAGVIIGVAFTRPAYARVLQYMDR